MYDWHLTTNYESSKNCLTFSGPVRFCNRIREYKINTVLIEPIEHIVGKSLHHSCMTGFTRQGILLPLDRQITAAVYPSFYIMLSCLFQDYLFHFYRFRYWLDTLPSIKYIFNVTVSNLSRFNRIWISYRWYL